MFCCVAADGQQQVVKSSQLTAQKSRVHAIISQTSLFSSVRRLL